jgi:D-hydroxyproline dehydrogenase subunit gamma
MFRRLPELATAPLFVVTIDGAAVNAREGDTVAAALLAAGCIDFRTTPVIGSKRGPYCLMGACFDCLVTIDGVPNRQACMLRIRDGMRIERQQGAASIPPGD